MRLGVDEVQVWRVPCGAEGAAGSGVSVLSPEEESRAASFRFEADRRRFTTCRSALRRVLGFHLGREASRIAFTEGGHGKPELPDAALRFNVAHSGDLALIAVARSRRVGVDVERVDRRLDYAALLGRICSEGERSRLESLAPDRARLEFYICWTRKEALLKAMGVGLSVSPAQFDVTPTDRAGDWEIRSLEVGAGYEAAVAARGFEWPMRVFEFSPLEWNRS